MGHEYVKRDETFNTSRNGTVPKPSDSDISSNKVLRADGKWVAGGGGGGGASSFSELEDVNFTNLQNGQVPKYNSTTQKWENANESGGGGTITDVEVDGVSVVNQQGVAKITTPDADDIDYDNQQSGLSATDVQSALDELAQNSGKVKDVEVNGISVLDAQNVAKIKSYKEVTQSEYNALPASKLTDNVMYCIKDAGGVDAFPPLIFSDEEREVGVWRDGKPLYQKTFNLGSMTIDTNWHNINHNISDIQKVIDIKGFCHSQSSGDWVVANAYRPTTTKGIMVVGTLTQIAWCNNYIDIDDAYVTIQYTKTTDTPGSGIWTTQGTLAHHYSTTEHIIGTWIDGKPLYEKVLQNEMPIITTDGTFVNKVIDISDINIDYPVKITVIESITIAGGHAQHYFLPYINNAGYIAKAFVTTGNSKNITLVGNHTGSSEAPVKIILQYTKTTD